MGGMGLEWMRLTSTAEGRVHVLLEHGTAMEIVNRVDHVLLISTFPPHAEEGVHWLVLHARRVAPVTRYLDAAPVVPALVCATRVLRPVLGITSQLLVHASRKYVQRTSTRVEGARPPVPIVQATPTHPLGLPHASATQDTTRNLQ